MAATGSALLERPDQPTAPGAGPAVLDRPFPAIEPEAGWPPAPEEPARTPARPAWVKALLLVVRRSKRNVLASRSLSLESVICSRG